MKKVPADMVAPERVTVISVGTPLPGTPVVDLRMVTVKEIVTIQATTI